MANEIKGFRGDYYFLSNFYPCRIAYNGKIYGNTEAAFQAQKTVNAAEQDEFTNLSPGEAKRKGRRVTLRKDWESVKNGIMLDIIRCKFKDPRLMECLLNTGDAYLEETNTWNDRYWGVCRGSGENHLGKILMQVRDEIRNTKNH